MSVFWVRTVERGDVEAKSSANVQGGTFTVGFGQQKILWLTGRHGAGVGQPRCPGVKAHTALSASWSEWGLMVLDGRISIFRREAGLSQEPPDGPLQEARS